MTTPNSTARSDSALGGWRPIETAPRDRTRILAITGDITDERFSHWSHLQFAVFHMGFTNQTGMDLGWSLFPGFGCGDEWLEAWQPLPEPPTPKDNSHD